MASFNVRVLRVLTLPKWQFKFFDVSQVKLPEGESAFLSEVTLHATDTSSQTNMRSLEISLL
jgi:hypothetical protein